MVSTEPTEIQLREISEADQETRFDMINQIKYRPVAIYYLMISLLSWRNYKIRWRPLTMKPPIKRLKNPLVIH